jgi:U3 small nucleolar RNA-associated protein 14
LAVSRSLTHKTEDTHSTDDEADENETIPDITLAQDPMNPWMLKRSDKTNIDAEFNFGYKKYLKDKMYKKKEDTDSESNDEDDDNGNNENSVTEMSTLKERVSKLSQSKDPKEEIIEYVIDAAAIKKIKLQNKSTSNVVKKKEPLPFTATSNWNVETIDSNEKHDVLNEVSTAFECLEDDVALKIEKKLKKLRTNIEKLQNYTEHGDFKRKKSHEEHDNFEYLKMKNKKTKAIIDEELLESNDYTSNNSLDEVKSLTKILEMAPKIIQESKNSDIDPNRFIEVKPKYLNTAIPSIDNDNDELDDEQVVPRVNIEEVFEEDDVVASFRQEKEDEKNKDEPTDIDLSLPGWGSWGGKGVKAPKRKRNRFILKAPPKMPRRDENKGDVIIKEYKNPKLAAHKITDIPFPFTSIKEYEASIRAPIGNTFIPEKAYKKLIQPEVITKAGSIIEPMDEEELLIPKNRNFNNKDVMKLFRKN